MRSWFGGMLVGWLVAGCGGALPEEEVTGEVPMAESAAPLTAGTASRLKLIFPPTEWGARMAEGPGGFTNFQGRLAFAGNYEDGRRSLFMSNGTEAGTVEVKGFPAVPYPGVTARMQWLAPAGNQLFFTVGEELYGNELWVSDGTTGGTRLVKDLTPGPTGTYLSNLYGLGTQLVFFKEFLDTTTWETTAEVWRSDGTAAGTVRAYDLAPRGEMYWQTARLRNLVVFFMIDASGVVSLWRTDGTPDGTRRLKVVSPAGSYVNNSLRTVGQQGYFSVSEPAGAVSLWKTDGTTAGTQRLYTSEPPSLYPGIMTALGNYLYVSVTNPDTQKLALFRLRLDGTGGKEHVITLPNPYAGKDENGDGEEDEAWPYIESPISVGNRMYFQLTIGSNGPAPRDTQLWVTDGTKAGTQLLRRPLSLSDEYGSPIYGVDSGLVFFSAYDPVQGIEPWVTNGTVAGTRQLADVAPVGQSSYPREYFRLDNTVYFSAYDDSKGVQVWKAPLLP